MRGSASPVGMLTRRSLQITGLWPPCRTAAAGLRSLPLHLQIKARLYTPSLSRERRHPIFEGVSTSPFEDLDASGVPNRSPFYFETAYSIFAKRPSRPFPPPFLSLPSGSFSDPLTTHQRARARHPSVHGQVIKGITNGDDAVVVGGQNFLCVNDGVGQWAQKERGHAALWSRLIAHFWVLGVEEVFKAKEVVELEDLDMVAYLQRALEQTQEVTSTKIAGDICGTTTACSALLHHRGQDQPVVLATNVGDCAVLIIRPGVEDPIYKTVEQWHWFDCPRQLGTNSPDQPKEVADMDVIDVKEGDVVLVLSDGVTDNLWESEICENITDNMLKWENAEKGTEDGLVFVARGLMNAAREVAEDPNAGSPYMERALDEGIPAEGGKLDDISVLIGVCRKR